MKGLLFLVLFVSHLASAQSTISGVVTDKKGEPVPFANVYLEDLFDGTSTDEAGKFTFTTQGTGALLLIVSSVGYQTTSKPIVLDGNTVSVVISLKSGGLELDAVVVSAGAFEASDEKKGTILKPLDIVTNPSASADLFQALATLPGVNQVNDQTGLFVRGGEASETQTIIDGTLVSNPFFGNVPDIPARGRFDPFLFKGTLFSTGGYSAQYGQALSSVLILNTEDLPSRDEYSIGLNMAGIDGALTKVWNDRTAIIGSLNYTNLSPLFAIVPQNRNWVTPPNGLGGALAFRHQPKEGAMLKSYLQYQNGNIALNFDPNGNPSTDNQFQNQNRNLFWNNSYRGSLGDQWRIFAAAALSIDDNTDQLGSDSFGASEWLGQGRITLSKGLGASLIRFGSELQAARSDFFFNDQSELLEDRFAALYAETDVRLGKKIAGRIGLRSEYTNSIDAFNIMPRVSLTYKTGGQSQVSFAYGQFFQTPTAESLLESGGLNYEKATHYILNYQWQTEQQIFRIEAYYKDYENLIRESFSTELTNEGFGFSRGVDVFWRDQKTIPNLTYWISYSLIDAQRLYRDFPVQATPTFVSTHTFSLIANYQFTPRHRLGVGYTYASGRPYFNPNNTEFLGDQTIDYHNLNISSSYLTTLWGNFSVLYLSVRNPFSFRQVFGYRYTDDGSTRNPITPATDWSFFAGISVSISS